MKEARTGGDGYPIFGKQDFEWFEKLAKRLVPKHPEDIKNVGRRKCGLDLVLVIDIAPRSRPIFTMKLCERLAALAAERTGVTSPLVYVHGDPHPRAREALNYAACNY